MLKQNLYLFISILLIALTSYRCRQIYNQNETIAIDQGKVQLEVFKSNFYDKTTSLLLGLSDSVFLHQINM